MSLFLLAALVKEPRFIPPHRLTASLSATDINGFATGEYAGWSGEEQIEEGTLAAHRRRYRRYREKENVCGPHRRKEAPRKIAREIPRRLDFFFPFLSLSLAFSLPFALFIEHARIRALRFK